MRKMMPRQRARVRNSPRTVERRRLPAPCAARTKRPDTRRGFVMRILTRPAFERARYRERRSRRDETVRLEERTRIAQELHDTLLQTYQSALMQLSATVFRVDHDSPIKPQLDRILQIMAQGIAEGRNTIRGLRSPGSQVSNLVVALSRVREEFDVQPNIDFRVIVAGEQEQLPACIQHEIYRIGREALVNAFCHSGATCVELELGYSDSSMCMRIRDNGCGIEPHVLEKGLDDHWGLAGMRERATRIGGSLRIVSTAMLGTEVQLSIPGTIAHGLSVSRRACA
jgi:signal transduction histidine kinase